jgi:hypothetical protein
VKTNGNVRNRQADLPVAIFLTAQNQNVADEDSQCTRDDPDIELRTLNKADKANATIGTVANI